MLISVIKINDLLCLHMAHILKDPIEQIPFFHTGHPSDFIQVTFYNEGGFKRLSDYYDLYTGSLHFTLRVLASSQEV